MTMDDLDRLVREFAPVVREFVTDAVGEFEARAKTQDATISELRSELSGLRGELLAIKSQPTPLNSQDIDALVKASTADAFAQIPIPKDGANGADGAPGKDGQSVTVDDVAPFITAEIEKAVSAIPAPKDGADGIDGKDGHSVTADDLRPLIADELAKAVATIPVPRDGSDGKDGVSVDPADVEAMVAKAVADIPTPQDGKSVTVEDLKPLIAAEVTKAVDSIPPPKDGVGVVSALIDREGRLILTLSDGATKDVGLVVGRDADLDDMHRAIVAEIEKWPRPKDGKDGLGFEDMSVVYDELGHMTLKFQRGDVIQTWPMHNPVFAGVFKEGTAYRRGALVQYGGHVWTAKEDTDGTVKPDEHTADGKRVWVMSVRRGREGKVGPAGPQGPKGKDGIDWGRK